MPTSELIAMIHVLARIDNLRSMHFLLIIQGTASTTFMRDL